MGWPGPEIGCWAFPALDALIFLLKFPLQPELCLTTRNCYAMPSWPPVVSFESGIDSYRRLAVFGWNGWFGSAARREFKLYNRLNPNWWVVANLQPYLIADLHSNHWMAFDSYTYNQCMNGGEVIGCATSNVWISAWQDHCVSYLMVGLKTSYNPCRIHLAEPKDMFGWVKEGEDDMYIIRHFGNTDWVINPGKTNISFASSCSMSDSRKKEILLVSKPSVISTSPVFISQRYH